MKQRPTLQTERLVLRPFTLDDARAVQRLAGDHAIAATTLLIPYPYPDGAAEQWIGTQQEEFDQGKGVVFAITLRDVGSLTGAIGLNIEQKHARAEMGYWIGKTYWNHGYATEAARSLLKYGFETLKLNRIQAHHFTRNPASGRVMQKIGMKHEARLRQYLKKWDELVDVEMHAILKSEWLSSRR